MTIFYYNIFIRGRYTITIPSQWIIPGTGIEPLAVVQEQHYDAWGLAFKPNNEQQITDNKTDRFTYNGKELVTNLRLGVE